MEEIIGNETFGNEDVGDVALNDGPNDGFNDVNFNEEKLSKLRTTFQLIKEPKQLQLIMLKNPKILNNLLTLSDLLFDEIQSLGLGIDYDKLVSSVLTVDVYAQLFLYQEDTHFDVFPIKYNTIKESDFTKKFVCFYNHRSTLYDDPTHMQTYQWLLTNVPNFDVILEHCIFSFGSRGLSINFFGISEEQAVIFYESIIHSVPPISTVMFIDHFTCIDMKNGWVNLAISNRISTNFSHCLHSIPRRLGYYKGDLFGTTRGIFNHVFDYDIIFEEKLDLKRSIIPTKDLNATKECGHQSFINCLCDGGTHGGHLIVPQRIAVSDFFDSVCDSYYCNKVISYPLPIDSILMTQNCNLNINCYESMSSILHQEPYFNWLSLCLKIFKEDAPIFMSLLLNALQNIQCEDKPLKEDDVNAILKFAEPYLSKMEEKVQELFVEKLSKPFFLANIPKKIKCLKWDDSVRSSIVVGIPWEIKRLILLLYMKPSMNVPLTKEIVMLIERAYVLNEMYDVLKTFKIQENDEQQSIQDFDAINSTNMGGMVMGNAMYQNDPYFNPHVFRQQRQQPYFRTI